VRRLLDLRRDGLGASLAARLGWPPVEHELRAFPDGESYIRLLSAVDDTEVTVLADLARPNARTLELLLVAATLRAQGARRVTLVAPYLPYMRQDRAFKPGESVSSRHFAALLDAHVDALLTVDAHLHRYATLDELYTTPARNLSATALLADWVRAHVGQPLLVGPDAESAQWVAAAGAALGCPWTTLHKERSGDRRVSVSGAIAAEHRARTPVLLDDVISTGHTLIAGCRRPWWWPCTGSSRTTPTRRSARRAPRTSSRRIPCRTRATRSTSPPCWPRRWRSSPRAQLHIARIFAARSTAAPREPGAASAAAGAGGHAICSKCASSASGMKRLRPA